MVNTWPRAERQNLAYRRRWRGGHAPQGAWPFSWVYARVWLHHETLIIDCSATSVKKNTKNDGMGLLHSRNALFLARRQVKQRHNNTLRDTLRYVTTH
jgi:hypothetical protein